MSKRAQKRKEYLSSFQKDASGKYVYTGACYRMEGSEAEVKRRRVRLGLLCLTLLISVVGSGCINAAGMSNTFYVIMPYIAEAAVLFALLWQAVRLLAGGRDVRAYVYESAQPKIAPLAMSLTFVSLTGFVCSGTFVALNGFEDKVFLCILYMSLKLFTAGVAFTTARFFGKIPWYKSADVVY